MQDLRDKKVVAFISELHKAVDFWAEEPDKPLYYLNAEDGRFKDVPCGVKPLYMVKQWAGSSNKDIGASSFFNETQAKEAISEAIYYCADSIAKWVYASDFEETKSVKFSPYTKTRLVLSVDVGDPDAPIGYGLDSSLKEYNTSAVRIVLEKDLEAPYGFSLVSACPDLSAEKARVPTGNQFMIENVVSSKKMPFVDVCDRLAALYRFYDGSQKVFYSPANGTYPPNAVARYVDGAKTVDIRIRETGNATITMKTQNRARRMTAFELHQEYPELARLMAAMMSDREKLLNRRAIEVDKNKFHLKDALNEGKEGR